MSGSETIRALRAQGGHAVVMAGCAATDNLTAVVGGFLAPPREGFCC